MFTNNISHRICNLILKRQVHGNTEALNNCVEVINRNPRNLEKLRIARKPAGYHLDVPKRSFWHKLNVKRSQHYVTAEIIHFENGVVVSASSQEWGFKKQLYRTNDISAFKAVGQVLAQRCLQSGICEVKCEKESSGKLELLINELEKGGVILREQDRYFHPWPWGLKRPEKPWLIHE